MAEFRAGNISAKAGAEELGITERRFRQLQAAYLQACALGCGEEWSPGTSGGNRRKGIPAEVEELWRRMLSADEPAPYGFAASEALSAFRLRG